MSSFHQAEHSGSHQFTAINVAWEVHRRLHYNLLYKGEKSLHILHRRRLFHLSPLLSPWTVVGPSLPAALLYVTPSVDFNALRAN